MTHNTFRTVHNPVCYGTVPSPQPNLELLAAERVEPESPELVRARGGAWERLVHQGTKYRKLNAIMVICPTPIFKPKDRRNIAYFDSTEAGDEFQCYKGQYYLARRRRISGFGVLQGEEECGVAIDIVLCNTSSRLAAKSLIGLRVIYSSQIASDLYRFVSINHPPSGPVDLGQYNI
ncbi:hypothetical protein SISNIDRAFT_492111 [Sistotremastrum niveocremeum HHB9708]|uniref:Uncharacterized protein n=1 Tax=Sistotremastrum niveocremeum HHB9708 TaxID=1314777 RepID=A0A164M2B9_9AGAM|nr:hypothetical protein SISNIDRAFT_492111 [Sistotremastrum niveocremeum HHB9708]